MNDLIKELDDEFRDDPDYQQLSEQEKLRIIRVMESMLELGMAAVYGDEDDNVPDADTPCEQYLNRCQATCCSYIFALTREEVNKGQIQFNKQKPYFIARDADGFCPHLNRDTRRCEIWASRPLRCRRYDCRKDEVIKPEWLE